MKYAWLLIGVFAARFFATAIAFGPGDGDLAWQRRLGAQILRHHTIPRNIGADSFTAVGAAWTAQEWLFSTLAASARSGWEWSLFAGGCAAAAVAALALAAYAARRRGASPWAVAVCTAFAGVALFASFGVRVQVIAWLIAVLFLFLLELDGAWSYAALAVALIWSNVHASAILAPVAAAAWALGTWLDEGMVTPHVRRASVLAIGSAVAICCNPFGASLPHEALAFFGNSYKQYITEWQATSLWDQTFAFGALPLLAIIVGLSTGSQPRRWRDFCLMAPFAFLLLGAARNIALFGIVALPVAACALTRNFAWFADTPETSLDKRARTVERVVLPAFSLVLSAVVAFVLVSTRGPVNDALASRPLAALEATPGEHRLLCADFAWCGLAVGRPHVRVFLDGRADPYPPAVWADYVAIASLHRHWRAALDAHRVDAVIVESGAPLDEALALTHAWHARYRDRTYRLWVRPTLVPARAVSAREPKAG